MAESDRQDPGAITAIDDPWRNKVFAALLLVALLDPLIILAVLVALGVRAWIVGLVVAAGLILPVFVVWLIVITAWNPNARRHPSKPIRPGAVSKDWQSFRFGCCTRFNNCVTIIADDSHLHLRPFAPLRWFGARTISLPLDRMEKIEKLRLGGLMRAVVDGRTIVGPDWCMRLAAPPAPDDQQAVTT